MAKSTKQTGRKDYLPTSAELAAGSRGDDVARLQTYLAKFGYLESPLLEAFGVRTVLAPLPAAERGIFDDATAEALSRFQAFNHLPVTGELNAATQDLM